MGPRALMETQLEVQGRVRLEVAVRSPTHPRSGSTPVPRSSTPTGFDPRPRPSDRNEAWMDVQDATHRRRRGTPAERFWRYVKKTESCWLWTGSHGPSGHGVLFAGAGQRPRLLRATAVSWEIANGRPVPAGLCVCHTCDNPPCVNPDHLFIGTQTDNMRDCVNKGRFKFLQPRRGETNNKAKLTWPVVRKVRADYSHGATLSHLSRRLGLARSTLREVVTGRCWREAGVMVIPRQKPR